MLQTVGSKGVGGKQPHRRLHFSKKLNCYGFFYMNKNFKSKQELRQAVWAYMEENNLVVFPRPCYGRIPNFAGSRVAAERLKTFTEWDDARILSCERCSFRKGI